MLLIDAIRSRRSVRAYTPRVVEEPAVRALLRAAVQAPSAINLQPWRFSIVQDVAQLKRYSDRAKERLLAAAATDHDAGHYAALLEDPGFNIFYDASTLVVIGVEARSPYSDADCWLAAENLMLAACDAGLGSCPIGFAVPVLNSPEVKAELGLPESGAAIAPILVGYPLVVPDPVERAEPRVLSWTR
jgi:nitroreductase